METLNAWQRNAKIRTERILTAALALFCERGIEDTSIEDVAKEARTGPATIYRYFETKAQLAVSGARFYWERTARKYIKTFESPLYKAANGKEKMTCIFEIFTEIFDKEFDFLKFLYEFDAFVMKYRIPRERLDEYEAGILNLKSYITDALEQGLADGTLHFQYSVDELYFSLTHTMLSLMQKLAANGRMLSSDDRVELALQVRIAGELLLKGLEQD